MTATYFVDTNVLVYARDASEPTRQPRAKDWMDWLWQQHAGRLSIQVLQEYYQVVTRKLQPGLSRQLARDDVGDLLAWQPVSMNGAVIEQAWAVEDEYSLSWWDALIVGAARYEQCDYLLSEDMQEGQELGGPVVLNPFSTTPPTFD